MATPVTDPALLAALNAGAKPVTDPAILAQLNAAPVDTTPAPTETVSYDAAGNPLGAPYTNTLPSAQQGKDLKGATGAFTDETLNRIPIVGPAIKGGTDRIVAASKALTGDKTYSEELKNVQDKTALQKTEHPNAATAGHVAGNTLGLAPLMALAPAAMGIDAGASLLANTGAGAATNALISGSDAAIRGEPIIENAVTGAVTGGAVPILGKVIGGIFNLVKPEAKTILSGFDSKAVKWAADAAKADGLTDAQIANMINEKGPQAFLGEYGNNTKGLTAAVGSMPGGEGKAALTTSIEQRSSAPQISSRMKAELDEALGKPQNITQLTLEGMDQRAKEADPLWQSFKNAKFQPTPEIKSLVSDLEGLKDVGVDVFGRAKRMAALDAVGSNKPKAPMENFFTTGERKDWPTAQSWQHVKEALDKEIEGSFNQYGKASTETRRLKAIKDRLDDTLGGSKVNKDAADLWNQAREKWGSHSSVMEAREAGKKAWDPKYTHDQMLEDLTNLSTPERAAYKEGARAALEEKMGNSISGDRQVRDLLRAPNVKDKISYLSGNKSYDPSKVIKAMENEANYANTSRLYGTTSEKEAIAAQKGNLTPNPEDLLINKLAEKYAIHIRPMDWLPGVSAAKGFSVGRQATKFENARSDLAKMLAAQGPQAQEYARALLATKPPSNAGPATASILRALAQPATPNIPLPFGLSQRNQ